MKNVWIDPAGSADAFALREPATAEQPAHARERIARDGAVAQTTASFSFRSIPCKTAPLKRS